MNTCPVSVILASSDNQRWLFSPYISTPTNRWPTQCKQTTVHPCLSRVCFSGPLLSWRTDFYGNDVSFSGYKCTCALTIKARSVTDRETYVCFLTICNSSFKMNCTVIGSGSKQVKSQKEHYQWHQLDSWQDPCLHKEMVKMGMHCTARLHIFRNSLI